MIIWHVDDVNIWVFTWWVRPDTAHHKLHKKEYSLFDLIKIIHEPNRTTQVVSSHSGDAQTSETVGKYTSNMLVRKPYFGQEVCLICPKIMMPH